MDNCYPYVKIINSTAYAVEGRVHYVSALCRDDDYSVKAHGRWEASGRGLCLVSMITAEVKVGGNRIKATPFTSSYGTADSLFQVVDKGDMNFLVQKME